MTANALAWEKSEAPRNDTYGEAFGERLNARATSFATRPLRKAILAVTELQYDNPTYELSSPPAPEDAYLVALHLKDYPVYEYWENGKAAPASALHAGDTIIYDIKRRPTFHLNNAFHSVHFYFSRAALEAIADHVHGRSIGELHYSPGVSKDDAVMRSLTQTLMPAFARPQEASRLFTENVMLAVGIHVACTYGDMETERSTVRGGLAPWQERRVKEILVANLDGDLSLALLASECGLSASHFSRAFRTSAGISPHQWLLQRRVELAKGLLEHGWMTLAEVALACGFADQSHLTRIFRRCAGISPGAWRRSYRM